MLIVQNRKKLTCMLTQTGMSIEKKDKHNSEELIKFLPLMKFKVFKLTVLILFQNINNCNQ